MRLYPGDVTGGGGPVIVKSSFVHDVMLSSNDSSLYIGSSLFISHGIAQAGAPPNSRLWA